MTSFRKILSLILTIVLSLAPLVTIVNAIQLTLVEDICVVFEKYGFRKVSA